MSLHSLGLDARTRNSARKFEQDTQQRILDELKRLNDFLAVMTNETDPPNEGPGQLDRL